MTSTFCLHCFSSGRALAEAAIAMGGYVSFSGILTFPKSTALREIARDMPEDRILVETDAPYLAPAPLSRQAQRARLGRAYGGDARRGAGTVAGAAGGG